MYYEPNESSFEVDWFEAVAPIRKKFRSLDIQSVFDGVDLIEEQPVLNEAVLKKPEVPKITPEQKERLEKKINVL
jgi:hypothetical protein